MRRLFLLLVVFTSLTALAQKPFELGAEYHYMVGKGFKDHIGGVRGESFPGKGSFSVGLTYQFSSSASYSTSKGFGIYAGYRYSLGNNTNGNNPFIGAKLMWHLLSWEGKSSLFSPMFTPIAEAGYHLVFAKHIFAAPTIGYGYTLRIIPDYNSLDEDAGGRLVPSLAAGYRF
ncbi:MAG: hypothetical protein JNN29_03960 [Chitinophagaceae bacterium]|nr:hypothetical protein [Chitinophagaceae bacterium]MBN8667930.1 hypothetical protein [Chitinophagales bacterium]